MLHNLLIDWAVRKRGRVQGKTIHARGLELRTQKEGRKKGDTFPGLNWVIRVGELVTAQAVGSEGRNQR